MKKSVIKIIALTAGILMCLGFLSACVKDYGYEYHYSVVGENGSISAEWGGEMHNIDESPVTGLGGEKRKS